MNILEAMEAVQDGKKVYIDHEPEVIYNRLINNYLATEDYKKHTVCFWDCVEWYIVKEDNHYEKCYNELVSVIDNVKEYNKNLLEDCLIIKFNKFTKNLIYLCENREWGLKAIKFLYKNKDFIEPKFLDLEIKFFGYSELMSLEDWLLRHYRNKLIDNFLT